MLIANGLFFKGAWRRKYFAPENTRISKFYINANKSVNVPYMHTIGRFYYAESPRLSAKILRIPYDVRDNLFNTLWIDNCRRITRINFFRVLNLPCILYCRICRPWITLSNELIHSCWRAIYGPCRNCLSMFGFQNSNSNLQAI